MSERFLMILLIVIVSLASVVQYAMRATTEVIRYQKNSLLKE